jgi:hypothetical protein
MHGIFTLFNVGYKYTIISCLHRISDKLFTHVMFFQLSCCSQELKKEKLKNAAALKELQEKAEQKLQDELQRKVVRFDICLSSLLHIC